MYRIDEIRNNDITTQHQTPTDNYNTLCTGNWDLWCTFKNVYALTKSSLPEQ